MLRLAGLRVGKVYPRVCGGTVAVPVLLAVVYGLSPRVRGNRIGGQLSMLKRRSIPACAGEPSTLCRVRCPASVYPRVCGGTLQV